VSLTGQHEAAVLALHHERLVTVDLAGCGYHVDAGEDLRLAVEQVVAHPRHVDQFGHGVVAAPSGVEFAR